MRVRNLSGIAINKPLWVALAEAMGLAGELPLALQDDGGVYCGTTLRATVNPQVKRPRGITTVACYSCGHIRFYPCPGCTFAFLTEQYLHELFHAWLDQVDPNLYLSWDHCARADKFARVGFLLLGGQPTDADVCAGYRLAESKAERLVDMFSGYAASLIYRRGSSIRRWRPPRTTGKSNTPLNLAGARLRRASAG